MTAYDLAAEYRAAYQAMNGVVPYIEVQGSDRFKVVNHLMQTCTYTTRDIQNLVRVMNRAA